MRLFGRTQNATPEPSVREAVATLLLQAGFLQAQSVETDDGPVISEGFNIWPADFGGGCIGVIWYANWAADDNPAATEASMLNVLAESLAPAGYISEIVTRPSGEYLVIQPGGGS